jgi:heterodisulfide reductase subunit C
MQSVKSGGTDARRVKALRTGTAELDRVLEERPIWKCQQCGLCSGICPSEKAGGIRPIDILTRASLGVLELDRERSLWLCAVCNSCTERCQMGVDPAEVIALLRGGAAGLGNIPKHFSEEAKLFIRSGLSFPNTGMTKKLRKDLGLDDLAIPPETMLELALLIKRTRLGEIRLD